MSESKHAEDADLELQAESQNLMKALVRSILFHRPDDVFEFVSEYFSEIPKLTQNATVAIVGPHTVTKWLVVDTLIRASGGTLVRVPVRCSKEIGACVREGAIPGVDFIFERRDIISQRILSKSSASGDLTIAHGECLSSSSNTPWVITQSSIDDIIQTGRIPLISDLETLEQAYTARSRLDDRCQLIIVYVSPAEPNQLKLEHEWTCANVGRCSLSTTTSYTKTTPTMSRIYRLIDKHNNSSSSSSSGNSKEKDLMEKEEGNGVATTVVMDPLGVGEVSLSSSSSSVVVNRVGLFHNISHQANKKDLIHVVSIQSILNLNDDDDKKMNDDDDDGKAVDVTTTTSDVMASSGDASSTVESSSSSSSEVVQSPPVPPPLPSAGTTAKSRFVKASSTPPVASSSVTESGYSGLVCWPRLACSRVRQLISSSSINLPEVNVRELSNILEAILSHLLEYSSSLASVHSRRDLIDD